MGDVGDTPRPIGIVTGLQVEADIARGIPHSIVLCLGPGPSKALQAGEMLVERGARSLMSFGVAGGLDPALQAGDVIASPAKLAEAFGAKTSAITTVADPALTPEDKAVLFEKSEASAVDMESSAVEAAAAAASVPYYFIRAICDEAGDTIPQIALKGVSPDGRTRPIRVAAGLATRPQDLAALLHLGRQQKKALAALKRHVHMARLLLA